MKFERRHIIKLPLQGAGMGLVTKPQVPLAALALPGAELSCPFRATMRITLIILISILTSCTQADMIHLVVPVGKVQIYPDPSSYSLPSIQYHFYNTDGETAHLVKDCDGYGNFNGTLPIGTYRVIATNIAASRVTFTNMDSYETAIVRLLPITSRSAMQYSLASPSRVGENYTLLPQPGNVYSTVIEELVVTAEEPVRKEPSPVLLTKRLNLTFTMEDGLADEVTAMSGILPGVYPAVHLYTHQGMGVEDGPGMATPFETTKDEDKRKAQIFLFGVRDPENGENYTHTMELELTMADNTVVPVNLDMTDTFSDIIDQNGGQMPVGVSIPIGVSKTNIGITVSVGGWIQEGETEWGN